MIDTDSPAGSYALAIAFSPNLRVEEYDSFAAKLERNLAIRRANRARKSQASIKGWETRHDNERNHRRAFIQHGLANTM